MNYHLPSFSRFDWTFRTSSVAIRSRLRIFTVVIVEFSGLGVEFDKPKWFDLFIINLLSDSNDDRCVTTTTAAFILLLLLLVLRLLFLLVFFYNNVASSTLPFSLLYRCVYRTKGCFYWLLHTHYSMLNKNDSKQQHLWRFSFLFFFFVCTFTYTKTS